jgi:hypothetical protein
VGGEEREVLVLVGGEGEKFDDDSELRKLEIREDL